MAKEMKNKVSYGREFMLSLAQLETCKNVPAADLDASIMRGIGNDSTCIAQSGRRADQGRRYSNFSYSRPKPVHAGVLGSGALRVCANEAVPLSSNNQNIGSLLKKSNEPYRPPHLNKIAAKRESTGSTDITTDALKIQSKEGADGNQRTGLLSVSHGSGHTFLLEPPTDSSDQSSLSRRSLDSDQSSLYSRSSDLDQSSLSSISTESDQSLSSKPLSTLSSSKYFPEKNERKTAPLSDVVTRMIYLPHRQSNVKPGNIKGSVLCSSESSYRGYKDTNEYCIINLDKKSKIYSSFGETPETKKFIKRQHSFDELCLPDENCLIMTDDFIDRQSDVKSSKTGPIFSCLAIDIAEELLASEDSCKENDMLWQSDLTSPDPYHGTSHIMTSLEMDQNIWNQPFYSWFQEAHLNSERANRHLDSRVRMKSEIELVDLGTCLFEKKSSVLFSSADVFSCTDQQCGEILNMEYSFSHPHMSTVQKGTTLHSRYHI